MGDAISSGRESKRRLAVFAAFAGVIGGMALAEPARASTPSLLWWGARQVGVNCLVRSSSSGGTLAFEASLCERVRSLAARGAPVAVQLAQPGDRIFISPDAVLLLVHASLERTAKGSVFAFTIRPYRPSGGEAEVFYGSAPRAIQLDAAAQNPALDTALAAALSEVLPWQNRHAKDRPI
jgi:hypothetical protein